MKRRSFLQFLGAAPAAAAVYPTAEAAQKVADSLTYKPLPQDEFDVDFCCSASAGYVQWELVPANGNGSLQGTEERLVFRKSR